MNGDNDPQAGNAITRRRFVQTVAAAGAGAALSAGRRGLAAGAGGGDELRIALIGAGNEGRVLLQSCVKIPGVRVVAVCDIWPYYRGYAARLLKAYKHLAKEYEDYRELLAGEKDLDAVIVATPDWMHAEQTIACLEAGRHVYCEKEMSNSIDGARSMVQAARKTKKLLQIGHQRRSNPRYAAALQYIDQRKALGRTTYVEGQWNRATPLIVGWPKGSELDEAALKKYGYDTMERLRNWRWYRKFSGGPMADLGSHQVDVFNWFLHAAPKAVMADGGRDYYDKIEWYDTITALYEWDYDFAGEVRTVRGCYQLLSTTSHLGYQESFLGTEGSLIISEQINKGGLRREQAAPVADWEKELDAKAAAAAQAAAADEPKDGEPAAGAGEIKIGHSIPSAGRYYAPIPPPPGPAKPLHMLHLENFFDAIRKGVPLNCPPEVGFETAVSVLKANEALAAGRRVELKAEDFKA